MEEGISQSGQEVTLAVAKNMGSRKSSACVMAAACGTDVFSVDAGINSDETVNGIIRKKIMKGTRNFAADPAMSEYECMQAITVGIEMAHDLAEKGYRILATGEMGIGNTTTSAAVAAALLGLDPAEAAGRGAGLNDEGLKRKISVIGKALEKYGFSGSNNAKTPEAAFEILRTVGGLDIAGLCGVFAGAAAEGIPVVIDGLISAVAALCAERMVPGTRSFMLASHFGKEPAMKYILDELGLDAPIHAGLKLGEGTGALMVFPLLEMALKVYETSSSFDDIGVVQYNRY